MCTSLCFFWKASSHVAFALGDLGTEKSKESGDLHSDTTVEEQVVHEGPPDLTQLNLQPSLAQGKAELGGSATKYNPKRFCLQFGKESDEEIERRKLLAKTTPITSVSEVM